MSDRSKKSKVYIINIDSFYEIDRYVWIIDKYNPSEPLFKISEEDFSLIDSGHYRAQGLSVRFNGKTYWLDKELYSKITKLKVNVENIGLSKTELFNLEYTSNAKYHVKDFSFVDSFTVDSKIILYTEKILIDKYVKLISDIESEFNDRGLKVDKLLYLPINKDNSSYKEKLIIEELLGSEIKDNKAIDIKDANVKNITVYEQLDFFNILIESNSLQSLFNHVLKYSDKDIRERILNMSIFDSVITFVYQTNNALNPTVKKSINISYPSSLIYLKSFEGLNIKRFV